MSYKKVNYDLECTGGITIAELIVKLKNLPQEDFCDEYFITCYKMVLEDPVDSLKKEISSLEQIVNNGEISLKKTKEKLLKCVQQLKELENNNNEK